MPRLRHKVHITVAQADIDGAIRSESKHCAVATGIKASVYGAIHPQVDIQTIRFTDVPSGKRFIYLTPPEVADYIVAFDAGDPIAPFEFDLVTPAYIGNMRTSVGVRDHDPEYEAIVSASRGENEDGVFSEGGTERSVRVAKTRVPKLIRDREYGRRRLRANQIRVDHTPRNQ